MSQNSTEPRQYPCRIPVGDADAQTVTACIERIKQLPEATERSVSGFLQEERYLVFQCLAMHHKDLVPLAEAILRSLHKILQVKVPDSETTPLQRLQGANMFG